MQKTWKNKMISTSLKMRILIATAFSVATLVRKRILDRQKSRSYQDWCIWDVDHRVLTVESFMEGERDTCQGVGKTWLRSDLEKECFHQEWGSLAISCVTIVWESYLFKARWKENGEEVDSRKAGWTTKGKILSDCCWSHQAHRW